MIERDTVQHQDFSNLVLPNLQRFDERQEMCFHHLLKRGVDDVFCF